GWTRHRTARPALRPAPRTRPRRRRGTARAPRRGGATRSRWPGAARAAGPPPAGTPRSRARCPAAAPDPAGVRARWSARGVHPAPHGTLHTPPGAPPPLARRAHPPNVRALRDSGAPYALLHRG